MNVLRIKQEGMMKSYIICIFSFSLIVFGGCSMGQPKNCDKGNCIDGEGTSVYENGQYIGSFQEKKRDGQGVYKWESGDVCKGNYEDGEREGQGEYIWKSTARYTGMWKDGKRNGEGTYIWPDGSRYTGQWKDNQRHGKGVYTFPDGTTIEGQWENDKYKGE